MNSVKCNFVKLFSTYRFSLRNSYVSQVTHTFPFVFPHMYVCHFLFIFKFMKKKVTYEWRNIMSSLLIIIIKNSTKKLDLNTRHHPKELFSKQEIIFLSFQKYIRYAHQLTWRRRQSGVVIWDHYYCFASIVKCEWNVCCVRMCDKKLE